MNVRNWAGRFGAVWGLLVAGLFLAGCASDRSKQEFSPVAGGPTATATGPAATSVTPTAVSNPADVNAGSTGSPPPVAMIGSPGTQILKTGDLLTVTFADLPVAVMPFEGRIKEDGTITLLLNQAFQAAGKTTGDLEKEIRERYVPRFFKYMTVTVKVQEGTRFYYVDGEVKSPGARPYVARIKILEAIASAGDFTEYAKKTNVLLTRADGRKIYVDCKKAQTHPEMNIEVLPDDRIHVRKSFW
jgi:polysaccharide export outer membrane protein